MLAIRAERLTVRKRVFGLRWKMGSVAGERAAHSERTGRFARIRTAAALPYSRQAWQTNTG